MKLDDLNLFRIIIENGSYTAASRKTSIPVATITRRIQALEEATQLRLLNRNARTLSLTEAGERFYNDCSPLLKRLEEKALHISNECQGASGKVKISAPSNTANLVIMPILNQFMVQYPDINIELSITNYIDNVDPTNKDILFSVGPQRDSSLIARKIHTIKDILVASPEYLAQTHTPIHVKELNRHTLLKGFPLKKWAFTHTSGEEVVVNEKGRFEASELNVVSKACLSGLGIALLPEVMIEEELTQGRLIHLLPDWTAETRDIYMMYNHKDHQPEKNRLLIDFISQYAF